MSLAEATQIAAQAAVECVSDSDVSAAMQRLISALEALTSWNVALTDELARLEKRVSQLEAFLVLTPSA